MRNNEKNIICFPFILFLVLSLFLFHSKALGEVRDLTLEGVSQLESKSRVRVGTYRALIIGINDYRDPKIPKLKTAVNDAGELADVLREKYGFEEVTLLKDRKANASGITRELRRLISKSQEEDSVLIYYAGHGDRDRLAGSGWWAPWDAAAGDSSTYIDNTVIQKIVKAIPARHVLLVSDSCFSGTLFGEERSLPPVIDDQFYASLYRERSRSGMTSGNKTTVEDSGFGGHSIFAWQFLKALKENKKTYLSPTEIYVKIGPIIRNNSKQMPRYGPIRYTGDAGGEFVFIHRASSSPPPPPPGPSRPLVIPPPKKERLYAKLVIGTSPLGADILINGEKVGDTQGGNLVWDKFPMGEYTVKTKKKGYKEMEAKLRLRREGKTLIIDMDPASPPSKPSPRPVSRKEIKKMVFIKGGCFEMGQSDEEKDGLIKKIGKEIYEKYYLDERPVHTVCVDDFYLGKYEVAVGEFRKFVSETGYRTEAEKGGGCYYYTGEKWEKDRNKYWDNPGFSQTEKHPVTCVSWNGRKGVFKVERGGNRPGLSPSHGSGVGVRGEEWGGK